MKPYYTMTQTIARPVEDVFEAVTRLDQFPTWSPRNPSGRRLTKGEITEGSRFELGIKGLGKVTMEPKEFEPNRNVMISPISRMFEGGHRWKFTDRGDGTTRIDHELELRPRGLFKLMAPMMRANGKTTLERTAEALKRHLEDGR